MAIHVEYVIVSRNRPSLVARCVRALRKTNELVFPGQPTTIFLVDDSTNLRASKEMSRLAALTTTSSVRMCYVGREHYDKLTSLLPGSSNRYLLQTLCSPLGTPGWNLHSARNFAWLVLRARPIQPTLVCILDDDILTTDARYEGLQLSASTDELLRQLQVSAIEGQQLAVGASFLGRDDRTLSQHLHGAILYPDRATPASSRSMPVTLCDKVDQAQVRTGVPSGGFILISPSLLDLFPLFPCYNEDWIWALLCRAKGRRIERSPLNVIHAPPKQAWPTQEMITFQEVGEIIYDVFSSISETQPANVDDWIVALNESMVDQIRSEHCEELRARLSDLQTGSYETVHRSASESAGEDIRMRAYALVLGAERSVQRLNIRAITQQIRLWLNSIGLWRDVVGSVRREWQGLLDDFTHDLY